MSAGPKGLAVAKFGGSSLVDPPALARLVEIVRDREGSPTVLVLSASGGTTDRLIRAAGAAREGRSAGWREELAGIEEHHRRLLTVPGVGAEAEGVRTHCESLLGEAARLLAGVGALGELPARIEARILAVGERLSTAIACRVLAAVGLPVTEVDARELVVTEERVPTAEPLLEPTTGATRARLLPLLEQGRIPVTQGFLGRGEAGTDTTLGRGGSDLSAALLGAALGAEAIEIWTDVDGVMTADPGIVPTARSIPSLSFRAAAELAWAGAKVLHSTCLAPAMAQGIPVRVRNSRRPGGAGTLLSCGEGGSAASVVGRSGVALLRLEPASGPDRPGFLAAVFSGLERHRIPLLAVSFSRGGLVVVVPEEPGLGPALAELAERCSAELLGERALLSVVDGGGATGVEIVARALAELPEVEATLLAGSGKDLRVAAVLPEAGLDGAVRLLHRRLVEEAEAQPAGWVRPREPRASRRWVGQ